jgi:branched-chain amino acid transport system permease protein
VDPFISLLICIPGLFVIGLLLDRFVFRFLVPLSGETKLKNSLLVSFGLTLILQNTAQQLFTADERSVQLSYAGTSLNLLGITLPYSRLIILGIALVTILALHLLLHRTYPGKAIRAVAEDGESAALAGIAGSLVVVGYGVDPSSGLTWTLKAVIVVTLAGTGSMLGVFPAGLLLGLVEAGSATVLGSTYREVIGLVMFLLVLGLRPSGLFGRA